MRLLRLASIATCLIVIASFLTFAVNEAKMASSRQQEELGSSPALAAGPAAGVNTSAQAPASGARAHHESSLHSTIDEAASSLTSPFSSLVSNANSEWEIRSLKLLAALLVYGFGLGYLARSLRVRV